MPKAKISQKQAREDAKKRHEAWLKSMGVRGKPSESPYELPDYRTNSNSPLSNSICSNGSKKEAKSYTGTRIKGIATMHKSNAVPITSEEQAKDISAMRYGSHK